MAAAVVPVLHASYPHTRAWLHCLIGDASETAKMRAALPRRSTYLVAADQSPLSAYAH